MVNRVPAMVSVTSRSSEVTNGPYRRGPIGRKLHYLGHMLIEFLQTQ